MTNRDIHPGDSWPFGQESPRWTYLNLSLLFVKISWNLIFFGKIDLSKNSGCQRAGDSFGNEKKNIFIFKTLQKVVPKLQQFRKPGPFSKKNKKSAKLISRGGSWKNLSLFLFCCWKYQETYFFFVKLFCRWILDGEGRGIPRD